MKLHLYDSTGKKVGKIISLYDETSGLVKIEIDDREYIIPFYSDRIGNTELLSTDNLTLYYLEEDGAGATYIEYDINSVLPKWYLTNLGWITTKPVKNFFNIDYLSVSDTNNSSPNNTSGSILAFEYTENGPDFRSGFTAPFEVK